MSLFKNIYRFEISDKMGAGEFILDGQITRLPNAVNSLQAVCDVLRLILNNSVDWQLVDGIAEIFLQNLHQLAHLLVGLRVCALVYLVEILMLFGRLLQIFIRAERIRIDAHIHLPVLGVFQKLLENR
jgi:hypothetical protein